MSELDMQQIMQSVIEKTNALATTAIQKKATSKGWPRPYAESLWVDITSENLIKLGNEAQDLEYGSLSQSPNPVVNDLQEQLVKTFTQVVRQEFASKGLVI